MKRLWNRLLFSPWFYPLWGPVALRVNTRLYGHQFDASTYWTSRLWTSTPWGRRRHAEKVARLKERRARYRVVK